MKGKHFLIVILPPFTNLLQAICLPRLTPFTLVAHWHSPGFASQRILGSLTRHKILLYCHVEFSHVEMLDCNVSTGFKC